MHLHALYAPCMHRSAVCVCQHALHACMHGSEPGRLCLCRHGIFKGLHRTQALFDQTLSRLVGLDPEHISQFISMAFVFSTLDDGFFA